MTSFIQKNQIEPLQWSTTCKFQNYIEKVIKSIVPKGIAVEFILLDTHYMYGRVNDMAELLDVIDKM